MSNEDPAQKESAQERLRQLARRDYHSLATDDRHDKKSEPRRQTGQAESTRHTSSAQLGEWNRCTLHIRHLPSRASDYGRDKIPSLPCSMTFGKGSTRDSLES